MNEKPKAGKGLTPMEAIQLAALGMGSLSDYGLADDEKNRAMLDELKRSYEEAMSRGLWVDVIN